MYELFTKVRPENNSVYKSSDMDNVVSAYKRQTDILVGYYHSRSMSVNNEHLLVRIIKQALSSLEYTIDHFVSVIESRVTALERNFQLCSSTVNGVFHNSVFFTGCSELLISDRDYFNPFEAVRSWSKLQPVKVLTSCITNLGMNIPAPRAQNSERGENVFSVNIPMLLTMFYGFCRYRLQEQKFQEVSVRVTEFVHMYVLPGMYQSHMDMVFFNRFRALYYSAPMGAALKRPPLPVYDYGEKLNKVLKEIIAKFKDNPYSYTSVLKSLPSVGCESMAQSLIMPDVAPTVQVYWVLYFSRLKHIELLVDLGGTKGRIYNSDMINRMKIDLQRLKSSKQFSTRMPKDLAYDCNLIVDKLLSV